MRIWGKIMKDNHLMRDHVAEDHSDASRTAKVFSALNEICVTFDLEVPIWLDSNVADFRRHSRTRFTRDSFIEKIDFDYLDFYVIEED